MSGAWLRTQHRDLPAVARHLLDHPVQRASIATKVQAAVAAMGGKGRRGE
ncbi:MAG: hypothetical protein ACYC3Q_02725 [Gemmatimonadaceae bacterium]